ncbi:MAG: hypothetical protein J6386_02360 [Candidatus Synoicihabitans palmerolidicus]|nr:hypothetical protein [Candidatus Synoicihabitans palmerolidicus]
MDQPDCVVYQAAGSYADSHCGQDWLNTLGRTQGIGKWCLAVDADELLVFSSRDAGSLVEWIPRLEAEGAEGVYALMVDMCATEPLSEVRYCAPEPFWECCDYFDPKGYFDVGFVDCPHTGIWGGVRQRLFYPEYTRRSFGDYLRWGIGLIARKTPGLCATNLVNLSYTMPPLLSKVPLVKWGEHTRYLPATDFVTKLKLSDFRAALLHLKFLGDFHDNAMREAARKEHYDGAREYVRYLCYLKKNRDLQPFTPEIVRYEGVESLGKYDLIRASDR